MTSVTKHSISASQSRVTLRWTGGDVKLQVLTSGFRAFDLQRQVDGGPWIDLGWTKRTSTTQTWTRGHVWHFRIRAVDMAGNWSSWDSWTVRP